MLLFVHTDYLLQEKGVIICGIIEEKSIDSYFSANVMLCRHQWYKSVGKRWKGFTIYKNGDHLSDISENGTEIGKITEKQKKCA